MNLSTIFANTEWTSLFGVFSKFYPTYIDRENLFAAAYREIRALTPVASEMEICVEVTLDADTPGAYDVSVYGRDGSCFPQQEHLPEVERVQARFNLSYTPWEEWLGMSAAQETLAAYKTSEIAAHCLWEMTYLGFSSVAIQRQMDELKVR